MTVAQFASRFSLLPALGLLCPSFEPPDEFDGAWFTHRPTRRLVAVPPPHLAPFAEALARWLVDEIQRDDPALAATPTR